MVRWRSDSAAPLHGEGRRFDPYTDYQNLMRLMKTILLCTTALLIAGCAVPVKPLCDREVQSWNKFNTVEDTCVDLPLVVTVRDKDGGSVKFTPDTPDEDDLDDTYVAETKNWARGVMVAALVLETSPERGESSSLSEPTIFK